MGQMGHILEEDDNGETLPRQTSEFSKWRRDSFKAEDAMMFQQSLDAAEKSSTSSVSKYLGRQPSVSLIQRAEEREYVIELQELEDEVQDGQRTWKEVAHWKGGLEQDVHVDKETGERTLTSPTLGGMTFHGFYLLRSLMSSGTVVLDYEGQAGEVETVLAKLVDTMVSERVLEGEYRDEVLGIMMSRHKHATSKKKMNKMTSRLSMRRSLRDLPFVKSGEDVPPASAVAYEGVDVMVGTVPFLKHPICGFIRLRRAVPLGDMTEEGYPTFGIFMVLGPEGEKGLADYRQAGRAFAIALSNDITATLVVESGEKTEILAAIDMFLDNATVLPNMPSNQRTKETLNEYNEKFGQGSSTFCCCIPVSSGDSTISIRLPHDEEERLQQKITQRLESRGRSELRDVHEAAHARGSRDLTAEEHRKLQEAQIPFDISKDWPWAVAVVAFIGMIIGIIYLTVENIWIEDEFHGDPATGFSFNEIYATLTLFISIWVCGKIAVLMGMPSLVGEILIGVVLGPNLLEFAPKVGALKMFGEIGLMLLVVEAGLDVDLEMLRLIGVRGLAVAIVGSMVPLAIGFAIGSQVMDLDTKGAFVVGASVAPTSMGIALNVLRTGGKLQTPVGQLIIAAAVLDDIIALVLLSEIKALESPTVWAFMKPIVAAIALLLIFGSFAIYVMPPAIEKLVKPRVAEKNHENLILGLILILTLALAPTALAAGSSYLLGCFIAGFCFCTEKLVHHVWVSQVKRILGWLLKIFFACTIGFEIPIKSFGDGQVIAYAIILMLAILGKLVTGFFAHRITTDNVLTISFAMSAWGEFAFIVVLYGKDEALIADDIFASVVLAILLSVILAPICLRATISYYGRKERTATKALEMQAYTGNSVGSFGGDRGTTSAKV